MAAPQTHMHDIPSIHASNPTVPATLGNLNLDRGVQAGDPILFGDLHHAKSVVSAYESGDDPLITPAVVASAELRAMEMSPYPASEATAAVMPVDVGGEL
ncbi:hypothetical protein M413DRAFT_25591 [Hebeloma cylindrosporum]|uniref:Uncharacterized protein n=1 Tax=Hebeloma cylindrosporum TaxID=76867 RepID=A0A0C2YT23_HEBCY|nr:hypothetical protein M413DRAFT_25591 [Hebeloma cylindrosporum h7]